MLKQTKNGTYTVSTDDLDIKSRNDKELRSTCPVCRTTREHPNDPSLGVNVTTGAGICHHCGAHFYVTDIADNQTNIRSITHYRHEDTEKDLKKDITPIDDIAIDYLAPRCIDPKVADKAHVGSTLINGIPYLAFPFYENDRVVNVQYKRDDNRKKEFRFAPGGRMIPWNINCITDGDGTGPLYITEGMMDALAMMQSGYWNTISVPNGAGSRMEVFDNYKALINKNFTHIVFAGDTDTAGIVLRNKVKEYFKGTDVSVVNWNWRDVHVKDANEMLIAGGTEAIANCVRNAVFEDTEGYVVATKNNPRLWNIYYKGIPEGKTIGLKDVDEIIRYLPGYMYVLTGYPGAGKSTFVNYVTMSLLHLYGWRTLYYTPEKMPEENHLKELVSIVTGKPLDNTVMSEDLMMSADEYLSGNVLHINESIDDLNKILTIAAKIVRRHGIKIFVIDPFMYLSLKELNGVTETTKITDMLRNIRRFAQKMKVLVFVIAHPRKPNLNASTPSIMQMMYEVAGSSGFFNTCDVGIALERPTPTGNTLNITCCKSRYENLGKLGEATVHFSSKTGRYSDDTATSLFQENIYTPWTYDPIYYGRKDVSDYESNAPF